MDGWLKTEDQALPLDPTYLLVLQVDKDRKAETGIVAVNLYSEICLVLKLKGNKMQVRNLILVLIIFGA